MCVGQQLCRLSNMDQKRLNKKVFTWSCIQTNRAKNWIHNVKKKLQLLEINININMPINKNLFLNDLKAALHKDAVIKWKSELNREAAKRGRGRNKLRHYRLFKNEFKAEAFVIHRITRRQRSSIAKFRAGVAPINIELGRYRNIPCEERFCVQCNNIVESEMHVLLHCPLYTDIRDTLFYNIEHTIGSMDELSDVHKLAIVLSNENIVNFSARACNDILVRRRAYVQ